jgi:AraC-like DNA-binding protein
VIDVEGVGQGPRFQLHHTNGQCWMEDRRINPNEFPELTETTWSRFICWTRREFPQATFALEAHVTHAKPEHAEAYERLWQVPVTFGSHWNAIRRTLSWGDVEIAPHNRYAFGVLTDRGDTLLQELERSQTMRGRVESLLLPRLHTGEASIDAVAAQFGSSRQTIYRNLKAEGVTFEQVLDDLRRRMATHYLNAGKVSVNETAYLVGFSDPASFSRAFKRWTGISPRAARVRAAAGHPPHQA